MPTASVKRCRAPSRSPFSTSTHPCTAQHTQHAQHGPSTPARPHGKRLVHPPAQRIHSPAHQRALSWQKHSLLSQSVHRCAGPACNPNQALSPGARVRVRTLLTKARALYRSLRSASSEYLSAASTCAKSGNRLRVCARTPRGRPGTHAKQKGRAASCSGACAGAPHSSAGGSASRAAGAGHSAAHRGAAHLSLKHVEEREVGGGPGLDARLLLLKLLRTGGTRSGRTTGTIAPPTCYVPVPPTHARLWYAR